MRDLLTPILVGFDRFMLAYLIMLTVWSTVLVAMGWRAVEDYVRRRPLRDYRAVANSPLSLPVSILAPALMESLDRSLVGEVVAACRTTQQQDLFVAPAWRR